MFFVDSNNGDVMEEASITKMSGETGKKNFVKVKPD